LKTSDQTKPPALPGSHPVLSVVAVLSGALALILTTYVIGGQYAAVANEGGHWLGLSREALKPLGLAALAGITSLILGIIVFARSLNRKAWGATAIIFGVLPLLFSMLIAGRSFFQQAARVSREVGRVQDHAMIDEYAGKPIPAGQDVYTWMQEREILRRWYDRHFVAGYLAHGHRSPLWDEAMGQFLQTWIKRKLGDPEAVDDRAFYEATRPILAAGCKDPLFLYLASSAQLENGEKSRLGRLAQTEAVKSQYCASLKWLIEIWADGLQRQFTFQISNSTEADQRALEFLRESLVKRDYREDEIVLLYQRLANNPGNAWRLRLNEEVCQMMEQTPECPRWFAELIRGQQEVKNAWKARGSGFAGTVTEQGWQGFEAHLARAEEKLVSSWKRNPKSPYAATEMIAVVMGAGGRPVSESRLWFDRAVAAQLDHYPAYDKLLWALRPRWHGSHEAMLRFGEVCLDTGRFDTQVPQYYVKAVNDISEELGDWSIYSKPQIYANVRRAFTGGATGDISRENRRSYLTGNMMLAHRAGRYEDAGKDLALLNDDPYVPIMPTWLDNAELVPGWIKVWNSPAQKQLLELDEARNRQDFTRALALAGHLRASMQGDKFLERWTADLRAVLELEQALATGNWVPIRPDRELHGWRIYTGDWKVNEDGSILAAAGVSGLMLKSLARTGPDFALRGEVEMVSSTTGEFQAGMVFGNLHPSASEWYGFRVMRGGDGKEQAVISRTFASNLRSYPTQLPKTNQFEVVFASGEISARLNGDELAKSFVLLRNKNRLPPRLAVGLGAFSHQNEYVLRYRNLEMKRLKPAVPAINPVDRK
jgi:hypothetical protein